MSRAVQSFGVGPSDRHTMVEVYRHGRWILYDPYFDVQPLVKGKPTTLIGWERRRGLTLRDDREHLPRLPVDGDGPLLRPDVPERRLTAHGSTSPRLIA
jgi:hypothetical protein